MINEPVLPLDAAPKPGAKFCPHCGGKLDTDRIISWGGWSFNESLNRFVEGTPGSNIYFSRTEAALISAILRCNGNAAGREGALYSALCDNRPEKDWPEMKMIDVVICKLRRKFEVHNMKFFHTAWGNGYAAVPYTDVPYVRERRQQLTISKEKGKESAKFRHSKLCKCGHITGHHFKKTISKLMNGTNRYLMMQCQVEGCGCQKFKEL